jgi:hypothetical protein
MRGEDFYGIYLILNDKLTNYLPFEGKILGDSRNNGINVEEGVKNNGRFRMILRPNEENCGNSDIFDSLIQTREIKALTGFLDKSPFKEIKNASSKMFKKESIFKEKKTKKPKCVKQEKTKDGGIYIIYLNNDLWKWGMVDDYGSMKERINRNKTDCIKQIKVFIDVLDQKELPKYNNCVVIYEKKVSLPKGAEEMIMKTIEDNKQDKIRLIQSDGSKNGTREYFICNDFNYVYNDILNLIKQIFK